MEEKGKRVFIDHTKLFSSKVLTNKTRIDEEPQGIISGLCADKKSIESIRKLRENYKKYN